MKKILIYTFLLTFLACQKDEITVTPNSPTTEITDKPDNCDDNCDTHTNDNIYYQDGERWLRGGTNPEMDFNISNWELGEHGLKHGVGREAFIALVHPNFLSREAYPRILHPEEEVVVLRGAEGIKMYPLSLLYAHEVINDEIDGEAIAVMYCPLADFVGVYSRKYCDATLTFALSGYTYSREGIYGGKQGFVLWDRNTESLWWPLIAKGVSGDMLGQKMQDYHLGKWEVTTYGEVEDKYSDFTILEPNQDIDFDAAWTTSLSQDIHCGE